MGKKSVVYATSICWNTTYPVGSHGYAREFLRQGWKVAFLSTPITPWHRLLSKDQESYKNRKIIHNQGGEWKEDGVLWEYVPWTLLPSKKWPHVWDMFGLGDLTRAIGRQKAFHHPDVVWIDTAEYGKLFERFPNALKIFRVVDKMSFFRGITDSFMKYQMKTARKADLVIATSFILEEELKASGLTNVLRVPNGVEINRFQMTAPPPVPDEYKTIEKPIVVYAGAIEEWFNLPLLVDAAKRLPHVSFVIIGGVGIDTASAKGIPNLIFLGKKNPDLITRYMYHADVGMIPFQTSDFVHAINPIKYYEYTACGLPVVATSSYELERLGEPVFLANDGVAFAAQIQQALRLPKQDLSALRNRVFNVSWSKRWAVVHDVLKERGKIL